MAQIGYRVIDTITYQEYDGTYASYLSLLSYFGLNPLLNTWVDETSQLYLDQISVYININGYLVKYSYVDPTFGINNGGFVGYDFDSGFRDIFTTDITNLDPQWALDKSSYSTIAYANSLTMSGPTGPQGIKGNTGSQGISGSTGSQGPIGITGSSWVINIPTGLTAGSRNFNQAYQVSSTRPSKISLSPQISCNLTLLAGQSGTITLDISSNGSTGWIVCKSIGGSNTGSLTIGLNTTQLTMAPLDQDLPAGYYWRLTTTNLTGTPTYTFNGGSYIIY